MSDLTNGIIKEINTQYIRIWNLEPGIYKLTYSGDKYIYYYGATNTGGMAQIYSGTQILKIWSYSKNTKKNWECTTGHQNYGTVLVGWSSESSGNALSTYYGGLIKSVNGDNQYKNAIYSPTTAGSSGQVLVSTGAAPKWSSDFYTKTEVDNAIQNAIGNVLNGDF